MELWSMLKYKFSLGQFLIITTNTVSQGQQGVSNDIDTTVSQSLDVVITFYQWFSNFLSLLEKIGMLLSKKLL